MDRSDSSDVTRIFHLVRRFSDVYKYQYMLAIVDAFSDKRFKHTLVSVEDGSHFPRAVADKFSFFVLQTKDNSPIRGWLKLKHLIAFEQPDICISYDSECFAAQWIAKLGGVPHRFHIQHTFYPSSADMKGSLLNGLKSRFLAYSVEQVISSCRSNYQWFRSISRVPDHKLSLVRPGVDSKQLRPPVCLAYTNNINKPRSHTGITNDKFIVGIRVEKNQMFFLASVLRSYEQACKKSQEFRENTMVFIHGDSDKLGRILSNVLAKLPDITKNVKLADYGNDSFNFYCTTDIVIQKYAIAYPTEEMLKAMSMGVPVLGFCSPRIRTLLDRNDIESENVISVFSTASIVSAMMKLFLCPLERGRIGRQSREHIQHYFNFNIFKGHFSELLSPRSARPEGIVSEHIDNHTA
ncbi:glycosyltransferase [Veronia pacifica]|uniref:Glycosyl transferase family 1 domain-containing protein n=1 Tax=Veronia pacifica TaxID=1080227 RepID=A0A1C3EPB9_9GAMM|nr:glycosyltransferase [Veronia pacifica]ODA35087.1 hypothetical protein A8L45_05260 [Veronia pacifica]